MDAAEARHFEWMRAVEACADLADKESLALVTGRTIRRTAAHAHPGSDTYAWLVNNETVNGVRAYWMPPCPVCGRATAGVTVRQDPAEDPYRLGGSPPRLPAIRPSVHVIPCDCRVEHAEWAVANERYWPPLPEPDPIPWTHHRGDRCRCGVYPTDEEWIFDERDGQRFRLSPCGHRPDGFADRRATESQESNDG